MGPPVTPPPGLPVYGPMSAIQQLLDLIKRMFVWWVVILPWQQGVRVRLGKHVRVLGPGVHWMVPFFDRVFVQSIRLRTVDIGIQTLATSDHKTLIVGATVQYAITDAYVLYNSLQDSVSTIMDLGAGAIAESVIHIASEDVTPRGIEEAVAESMNLEKYGIGSVKVQITDFAFIKAYRLVKDDRMFRHTDFLGMDYHIGAK